MDHGDTVDLPQFISHVHQTCGGETDKERLWEFTILRSVSLSDQQIWATSYLLRRGRNNPEVDTLTNNCTVVQRDTEENKRLSDVSQIALTHACGWHRCGNTCKQVFTVNSDWSSGDSAEGFSMNSMTSQWHQRQELPVPTVIIGAFSSSLSMQRIWIQQTVLRGRNVPAVLFIFRHMLVVFLPLFDES